MKWCINIKNMHMRWVTIWKLHVVISFQDLDKLNTKKYDECNLDPRLSVSASNISRRNSQNGERRRSSSLSSSRRMSSGSIHKDIHRYETWLLIYLVNHKSKYSLTRNMSFHSWKLKNKHFFSWYRAQMHKYPKVLSDASYDNSVILRADVGSAEGVRRSHSKRASRVGAH